MTIDELNALAAAGEMDEFIRVCEARQCKALAKIADDIVARPGVRLVLLAGGSSAGKTTTAKRLCTQLRVNGRQAVHFSTDDYFVGDRRNPRDENGELDYETIEAVDVARLSADMNALLAGKSVHLRRFDFEKHEGYEAKALTTVTPDTVIVLEGIHALNPRLTEGVDGNCMFRLYIEPVPKIEVFGPSCLRPSSARLLRRLVRDNGFRKMPPEVTLDMWPKVMAGEEKWIKPYRGNADATFDSSLDYELAVLKPYVGGLLARALLKRPDSPIVQNLADLVGSVRAVSAVAVPGDSILRETIGNSQLAY